MDAQDPGQHGLTVTVRVDDLRAVLQAADYMTDRSLIGPVDRMTDALVLASRARPAKCTDEFCEHDHTAPPEKAALLKAIREAATLALNGVYGTDDRHEYMALRIADTAVNGTPLPWKYESRTTEWTTTQDSTIPTTEKDSS